MDANARVDYFRSEIEGKIATLRSEMNDRQKLVDAKIVALEESLNRAIRELRRI